MFCLGPVESGDEHGDGDFRTGGGLRRNDGGQKFDGGDGLRAQLVQFDARQRTLLRSEIFGM
jgi:hypothetical protein